MSDNKNGNGNSNGNGPNAPSNPLLKTRWSQYDRWLRPEYVGDAPFQLTIRNVTSEEGHLAGRAVKTLALSFDEVPNLLALSPTNQRTLAMLFGNVVGSAIGQKITIQKTRTKFGPSWKYPLRILFNPAPIAAEPGDTQYVPLTGSDTADEIQELISEEIE